MKNETPKMCCTCDYWTLTNKNLTNGTCKVTNKCKEYEEYCGYWVDCEEKKKEKSGNKKYHSAYSA